jgi:hypothetical protein
MEQTKLTREEWNSIELPVSAEEKAIFLFIREAFGNIQLQLPRCISAYTYLKIPPSKELDLHLAHLYFKHPQLPPLEKVKLKINHPYPKIFMHQLLFLTLVLDFLNLSIAYF